MFRTMLAEGRNLIRQRNAIEDRVVELLAEHSDYRMLRTILGIGPINALTILAVMGPTPGTVWKRHAVSSFPCVGFELTGHDIDALLPVAEPSGKQIDRHSRLGRQIGRLRLAIRRPRM